MDVDRKARSPARRALARAPDPPHHEETRDVKAWRNSAAR